jgi:hypothetical protein
VARAMRGVATRYPKFVKTYGRVMSIEDFLTMHAPEKTAKRCGPSPTTISI